MSPLGAKYLYQRLFHFLTDPVMVVNKDWKILDCNEATTRSYGYTREEFLALDLEQIIHPDFHAEHRKNMQALIRGKSVLTELVHIRRDGSSFPVEIHARDVTYDDEMCVIAVVRDITKRKKAEEEIRREKHFSDSLIRSLPGVFYLIDENINLLRWNIQLEEASEYSGEEISQMNPLDFFVEEDRNSVVEKIMEVFEKGEATMEVCGLTKSGKIIPYYLTGIRMSLGDTKYLLGVGIDITEYKKTEEE